MGVYLRDNEPARDQFRSPRRERASGVCVVHTAENTPDFVAFDGGAEAVARFIQGRSDPGSYHDLVDSDSAIQLVSYDDEAYQDGTGSNRHAWGGSVATRADVWPLAPKVWRDGAVRQLARAAARYARWLKAKYGITVPARRITRAQSEDRVPGFISHAERDPARRSDPGAGFPWDQFFDEYRAALSGITPQPPTRPEEDDMRIADCQGKPALLVGPDGTQKLSSVQRNALIKLGVEAKLVTGAEHAALVELGEARKQLLNAAIDGVINLHAAIDSSGLRRALEAELDEQTPA